MGWTVALHDEFDAEYAALDEPVQNELLAMLILLRTLGPQLGRPHADTLSGSRHANMKELRFTAAGGVWRLPSRSINSARQSFSSLATRAASPSNASTRS